MNEQWTKMEIKKALKHSEILDGPVCSPSHVRVSCTCPQQFNILLIQFTCTAKIAMKIIHVKDRKLEREKIHAGLCAKNKWAFC